MRARLAAVAFAAAAAGCQGSPINTPIRSFDRPSDVALACAFLDPKATGQWYDVRPLSECVTDRSRFAEPVWCDEYLNGPEFAANITAVNPNDGTQNTMYPSLFALVTQSARGEVALVGVDDAFIRDLDPQTPGFNFLPVGKLPEHVRTSLDGCRAVTANSDSCDLALLDVPVMLNMPIFGARESHDGGFVPSTGPACVPNVAGQDMGLDCPGVNSTINGPCPYVGFVPPKTYEDSVVTRVVPSVNGRPLGARPSWIEMAPESTAGVAAQGECTGGSYAAWVALPGCQLVVEVAIQDYSIDGTMIAPGEVVRAVQVTPQGTKVVTDLSSLSCPSECSGPVPDGGTPSGQTDVDAGAINGGGDGGGDGGAVLRPITQSFPSTIAIEPIKESDNPQLPTLAEARMIIGDSNGERLTIIPLDTKSGALGAPRGVTLEAGAGGVQNVRISPRSQAGKFLYAVARDASVRVIDLNREVECETNPDPRWLNNPATGQQVPSTFPYPLANGTAPEARSLGCFPLGLPSTPPRSPLSTTPGIQVGGMALPRDIAFVHVNQPLLPTDPTVVPASAGGGTFMGDFAWIVSSDGRATPINIFDACTPPNTPQGGPGTSMGTYTPPCDPGNVLPSLEIVEPGRPIPLILDRISHRTRLGTNRFFPPTSCFDSTGSPRLQDETHPFTLTVNNLPVEDSVDGGTAVPDGSVRNDPNLFPALVAQALPPVVGSGCAVALQRNISFPDIDHVHNETWTLAWEGVLPGTGRVLGRPRAGIVNGVPTVTLVDTGATYCAHGVQAGDKVQLGGCNSDSDCDFSQTCQRAPTQQTNILNGLCLDRRDGASQLDALVTECGPLLSSERQYRVAHARQNTRPTIGSPGELVDELVLQEIYEPEHRFSGGADTCTTDADCADEPVIGSTQEITNGTVPPGGLATRCLPDYPDANGVAIKRCLRPCTADGRPAVGSADAGVVDGGVSDVGQCGDGFICSKSQIADDLRCMRAPLKWAAPNPMSQDPSTLLQDCLNEAIAYEVHAGNAFVVSGSATGFLSDLAPNAITHECERPVATNPHLQEYVRLHQGRLPIVAPPCPVDAPNSTMGVNPPGIGFVHPLDITSVNDVLRGFTPGLLDASALNPLDVTKLDLTQPNFCQYSDPLQPDAYIVRYENPYFVIGLDFPVKQRSPLLPEVPPDLFALQFVVIGGSAPAVLTLGVDIPAQSPRSVVTEPDGQTFLVVDEGKTTTATGLRGQLIKVSSAPPGNDRFFIVR